MDEIVVDSTVVIDFLNGQPQAHEFAGSSPSSSWLLHPAVEAEVLVGARDRIELKWLEARVAAFRRIRPDRSDFDHCMAFLRRHTLAHGIGWPDCLIAATALRLGLPVVTLNTKHFRVIKGLRVIEPY